MFSQVIYVLTGKGLNPDDFLETEEEEFVVFSEPTLEDKLDNASLQEIDELEVSHTSCLIGIVLIASHDEEEGSVDVTSLLAV